MKNLRRTLAVAALAAGLLALLVGCAVRFRGAELLVVHPLADVHIHYPQGATNGP